MKKEELSREELLEKLTILETKLESAKRASKKYLHSNQEKRLWHSCKSNANRKNVPFNLLQEDIVIPKKCKYLGIELTNTFDEGRVASNASIDRLVPELGYVKGNIQVISDLANRMKQNATKEQLLAFARGILRLHRKGDL